MLGRILWHARRRYPPSCSWEQCSSICWSDFTIYFCPAAHLAQEWSGGQFSSMRFAEQASLMGVCVQRILDISMLWGWCASQSHDLMSHCSASVFNATLPDTWTRLPTYLGATSVASWSTPAQSRAFLAEVVSTSVKLAPPPPHTGVRVGRVRVRCRQIWPTAAANRQIPAQSWPVLIAIASELQHVVRHRTWWARVVPTRPELARQFRPAFQESRCHLSGTMIGQHGIAS